MNLLLVNLNDQDPVPDASTLAAEGWSGPVRRPAGRWLAGLLLAALACFHSVTAPAAPTVEATVDRNSVPLGESVSYTLTFIDATPPNAPALPEIPGLQATSVSRSSQVTIVNGRTTHMLSFIYNLTTTRMGNLTIPAMRIQMGTTVLNTPPIALQVTQPNPANETTNLAFIRLVIPKKTVYVQEPFLLEMHLYWQNAKDVSFPELKADGFIVSNPTQPRQTKTRVGNRIFDVAIFQRVVSAKTNGTFTLGPATGSLTLRIPRTQNPGDPLGIFGGGYQFRQATITSDPETITVLPLPPGPPPGFHGTVGSFQLSVQASPTELGAGDPITLRAQLRGQGAIEALTLPPQPNWREDDFKTYPPSSSVQIADGLGLQGTKSFEQVIIPLNHEITLLPPLEFTYFDVNQRRYLTLSNAPIPLIVRPATGSPSPLPVLTNSASASQEEPAVDDILHIRAQIEDGGVAGTPLIAQPWFILIQGVPVMAWLVLLAIRKRKESLASNPRLQRQREVNQRVREGLRELDSHAAKQEGEQFFALLFRLLQDQLGERLDLPASAITEAVVSERLSENGLSPESMETLQRLFLLCNQARYASNQSSEELTSLMPRVRSTIETLRGLKP